jgi:hypothetical protein
MAVLAQLLLGLSIETTDKQLPQRCSLQFETGTKHSSEFHGSEQTREAFSPVFHLLSFLFG